LLWDRQVKITAGSPGGVGFMVTDLNVTFNIEKDSTKETNKSNIKIYNLNPDNYNLFNKDDIYVMLDAGYARDQGLVRLFSGNVVNSETYVENTNQITELHLQDGYVKIRDSIFSQGYAPGTQGISIVQDVAGAMGLKPSVAPDVQLLAYPNGFTFYGYAADCMTKLCQGANAVWSIQNGILQIINEGGSTGVLGMVLSKDTGMIGYPRRIIRAAKQATSKGISRKNSHEKKAGWRVKSLLRPSANPGDIVQVKSTLIEGYFAIESLKHQGETRGPQWETELDLIELKYQGS
jgi:hypothetical protein